MEYADPTDMPADERMTDAEFRCVREWLAVTGDWLANHLGVEGRTVRRWEAGTSPIPDGVRLHLETLEAMTGEAVDTLVQTLAGHRDPALTVYRTDNDYQAAHPDATMPASWHRRVVMRVALDVPGVSITYSPVTP